MAPPRKFKGSRDGARQVVTKGAHEKAYILLADDSADERGYLSQLLIERGYEVKLAADGNEALEAAHQRPPDLLIADITMPRLDGFALMKAIRAESVLCELPVIFLSARTGEDALVEGLEVGCDGYLVKPFSARELLARVACSIALSRVRRKATATRLRTNLAQALGGMLTALAHDAQQPLAASALYVKTARHLLHKPPEQRIANVEDVLAGAESQIIRAGEIIGRLRELVPNDESDKFFENLHELIEEAQQVIRAEAKQRIVWVTLQLSAENDRVLVNRVQIKQVITYLMRTAVEAMSACEKCELTVTTSSIERDTIQFDAATIPLISEGTNGFLFEAFRSAKAHGMPVGLLISRTIIDGHHGRIWGEPGADGGAVFSFTLPLMEVALDQ